MVKAFAVLIGAQLLGELLRRLLQLPLPGPVIGMLVLGVALLLARPQAERSRDSELNNTADGLIANMGLLFVPAGVGIVAEGGILRQYWLSISVGVVLSTVLGLLVTAWVMHRFTPGHRRTRVDAEEEA
ncbi:MAG TPA: CidA/LrgA family protein [Xanthomonadaceae bacterium]|nr:CidA/LrgA family protein [Xanthomonadaceae bacterium]